MTRFSGDARKVLGRVAGVVAALVFCATASGDDWPNWRGPNWDGTTSEKVGNVDLANANVLWRATVGKGWSSVAVAAERAYTMGNSKNQDTVFCFNATTGKVVWQKSYDCKAGNYAGPRSTPTVAGDRVYTLSRAGHLNCYDAANGDVKWSTKIAARPPSWGFTGSPRLLGKRLIVNVGGKGLAYDVDTGEKVWGNTGGKSGYATPVIVDKGDDASVLVFSSKSLYRLKAADGSVTWSYPWQTKYDVNAADPMVLPNGNVFISSGYNHGCAMLTADGRKLWENRNMRNHFNTCVLKDGFIYGIDDNQLRCLDAKTGTVKWTERSPRKGGLILADDTLVILGERGELILAKATSDRFEAITRGSVISGRCWTPPTMSNGRVFCRTSDGKVACVSVK